MIRYIDNPESTLDHSILETRELVQTTRLGWTYAETPTFDKCEFCGCRDSYVMLVLEVDRMLCQQCREGIWLTDDSDDDEF